MNVTCPACRTVYRVDPRKVAPGGVRARCARCPSEFEVEDATVTASVSGAGEVTSTAEMHEAAFGGLVAGAATALGGVDAVSDAAAERADHARESGAEPAGMDLEPEPCGAREDGAEHGYLTERQANRPDEDRYAADYLTRETGVGSPAVDDTARDQVDAGTSPEGYDTHTPPATEAAIEPSSASSGSDSATEPEPVGHMEPTSPPQPEPAEEVAASGMGWVRVGDDYSTPSANADPLAANDRIEYAAPENEDGDAPAHYRTVSPETEPKPAAHAPADHPRGVVEASDAENTQPEPEAAPALGTEMPSQEGFATVPPRTDEEITLPPPPFGSSDPHSRAQRLARALVSDIAVYHPDRRQRSLQQGTIRQEFRDEIRKSWEEYVAQVGNQIARETSYFRDALNELLAGGARLF